MIGESILLYHCRVCENGLNRLRACMCFDEVSELMILRKLVSNCVVFFAFAVPDNVPSLSAAREFCYEKRHVEQCPIQKLQLVQVNFRWKLQSVGKHLPSQQLRLSQELNILLQTFSRRTLLRQSLI